MVFFDHRTGAIRHVMYGGGNRITLGAVHRVGPAAYRGDVGIDALDEVARLLNEMIRAVTSRILYPASNIQICSPWTLRHGRLRRDRLFHRVAKREDTRNATNPTTTTRHTRMRDRLRSSGPGHALWIASA